jgi:hypothetical protein
MIDQLLIDTPLAPSTPGLSEALCSLWGALFQAFTIDDVYQRKIK